MKAKNIIAGPCAVESEKVFRETVSFLTGVGIKYVRGGVKKYRSDPKTFQGMCMLDAIDLVKELKQEFGFKYVVEVFSKEDMMVLDEVADIFQIGARNAYNTELLKETNEFKKPVLYKRGLTMTLEEWIAHSAYIKNPKVMCLRGVFSIFPSDQRFFPDVSDVQRMKHRVKDLVCYDASHSACERRYVPNLAACAGIMGADCLMIECHPDPANALSDPKQQLNFREFEALLKRIVE